MKNVFLLFLLIPIAVSAQSKVFLKQEVARQVIVESIYNFSTADYSEGGVLLFPSKRPVFERGAPENVLVDYIFLMADGRVDEAKRLWDEPSIILIDKLNSKAGRDDVIRGARVLHAGTYLFNKKIKYEGYVIVVLKKIDSKGGGVDEAYALNMVGGVWKLTQKLADDPVFCCHNDKNNRVQRMGVPGGEFKNFLEQLGVGRK